MTMSFPNSPFSSPEGTFGDLFERAARAREARLASAFVAQIQIQHYNNLIASGAPEDVAIELAKSTPEAAFKIISDTILGIANSKLATGLVDIYRQEVQGYQNDRRDETIKADAPAEEPADAEADSDQVPEYIAELLGRAGIPLENVRVVNL